LERAVDQPPEVEPDLDLGVWITLVLAVCVGIMLTRFNPTVMSSRSVLFSLTIVAVAGAAAVVVLVVVYGAPILTPSGVANPDGGG
jgi:hypothetical protein